MTRNTQTKEQTMNVHDAYRAFMRADNAWHDELVKVFGKRAGDARYTPEGKSTPMLKELHTAFQDAGLQWRRLMVSNGRSVA